MKIVIAFLHRTKIIISRYNNFAFTFILHQLFSFIPFSNKIDRLKIHQLKSFNRNLSQSPLNPNIKEDLKTTMK